MEEDFMMIFLGDHDDFCMIMNIFSDPNGFFFPDTNFCFSDPNIFTHIFSNPNGVSLAEE